LKSKNIDLKTPSLIVKLTPSCYSTKKDLNESSFVKNPASKKETEPEMTKRFYAACVAMQGLLCSELHGITIEKAKERSPSVVKLAYAYADELLKQEHE